LPVHLMRDDRIFVERFRQRDALYKIGRLVDLRTICAIDDDFDGFLAQSSRGDCRRIGKRW